jgi:predicted transport protein
VQRRVVKWYIGYFAGKRSFFTMELQKAKINVYLSLDPESLQPWNPEAMRDVTKIGKFGLGNTEYVIRSADQLPELQDLVSRSYLANRQ